MPNTTVALVGNLTRDPELKFTQSGLPVANFSIAVSEGTKDNPKTSFYDVSAWRSLAQNAVDSLHKGLRVVVFGVLDQSNWEDNDGNKRTRVQVTAEALGPDLRFHTAHVQSTSAPQQAQGITQAPQQGAPQGYPDSATQAPRDFREEPF